MTIGTDTLGWFGLISWVALFVLYDEMRDYRGHWWIGLSAAAIAIAFSAVWLIAAWLEP